jgi:hypothetical protein
LHGLENPVLYGGGQLPIFRRIDINGANEGFDAAHILLPGLLSEAVEMNR